MKVAVCCKAVPESIKKVKLDENKGTVECESFSLLMNECDEYALDAALMWKKEQGAGCHSAYDGEYSESGYPLHGLGQRCRSSVSIR